MPREPSRSFSAVASCWLYPSLPWTIAALWACCSVMNGFSAATCWLLLATPTKMYLSPEVVKVAP